MVDISKPARDSKYTCHFCENDFKNREKLLALEALHSMKSRFGLRQVALGSAPQRKLPCKSGTPSDVSMEKRGKCDRPFATELRLELLPLLQCACQQNVQTVKQNTIQKGKKRIRRNTNNTATSANNKK